ncbi:MAG: hypothetical protein U7127_26090 [Phormidium sp.]
MRRFRFWAIGLISFLSIATGTILHRALAVSLCAVLGFNSTVCYLGDGDRVNAAVPPGRSDVGAIIAQGTDIFRNDGGSSQPQQTDIFRNPNPQNPNQPGEDIFRNPNPQNPNQPGEDIFKNPNPKNPQINPPDGGSQVSGNSSDDAPLYVFYVNGIQTTRGVYTETIAMLEENLLNGLNFKWASKETYNYGGSKFGDVAESALQEYFQRALSEDGSQLENKIVQVIKQLDEQEAEKAKQSCKPRKRARFLLIGHSQGTIFLNGIALKLRRAFPKDREIYKRTSLLAFAPFTNFAEVREGAEAFNLEYLLRQDDFPALWGIRFFTPRVSSKYIPYNLPCLLKCPSIREMLKQALDSHYIGNYLGQPNSTQYEADSQKALAQAKEKLNLLVKKFQAGEYEKKKDCSSITQQPPQPQQTAQQSNLTRRNCRVPKEFFKDKRVVRGIRMDDYICVIREPVMTDGGPVDGVTACGTCDVWGNFGLPPKKSSCNSRAIDSDRSNQVPTCPSNWYGGS